MEYFRVRCYGPGIEPTGVIVNAPANFTVETFAAGKGEKFSDLKE
jgi:filamin